MARPRFPLRVACVDIGSNGIRSFGVEFTGPDAFRTLLSDRAPVRLGHSVFLHGAIAKEDMEAALRALAGFKLEADALSVRHLRVVATSAVREAANRADFIRRARKECGIEVEAISGAEEARLQHLAITRRMKIEKPMMLMDLGGGSLEISLVDAKGILWSESHPLGAVRLLEDFQSIKGDQKRFERLIAETVGAFRIPAASQGRQPAGLVATGGNIEEIARLLGSKETEEVAKVKVDDLEKLTERLVGLDVAQRVQQLGIRPDRADVILPAAFIHLHVAKLAGVREILVPKVGLKEGIAWDLLDSVALRTDPARRHGDIVRDGALALGRRFHFEESHGVQVTRLAESLFDQLAKLHGMGAPERELLVAASILHDVGRFIGDRRHHKHSYYLVSESDLPGLGPREVEMVAQVSRYHRRSEPSLDHEPFAKLHPADRQKVERLSALLRVADALDREHQGAVQEVKVRKRKGRLVLEVHGKASDDFLLEQWAIQQKGGLFTRLWGLPLEVKKA